MKIGDVAFNTDDNIAPLQWPLCRIARVYIKPDSFVQVVKVRIQSGVYNRAAHKLKRTALTFRLKTLIFSFFVEKLECFTKLC